MNEDALIQAFSRRDNNKSFIDNALGRREVESIREIMKKPSLNRSDLLDLLNLCSSNEAKLFNYNEWDRYVLAKFYVWIRQFVTLLEGLYDYDELLKDKVETGKMKMSDRMTANFNSAKYKYEHDLKFLVDLYLNLARTTMSLNSTAFTEILRNKFEISYPQQGQNNIQPEKSKIWGIGK